MIKVEIDSVGIHQKQQQQQQLLVVVILIHHEVQEDVKGISCYIIYFWESAWWTWHSSIHLVGSRQYSLLYLFKQNYAMQVAVMNDMISFFLLNILGIWENPRLSLKNNLNMQFQHSIIIQYKKEPKIHVLDQNIDSY